MDNLYKWHEPIISYAPYIPTSEREAVAQILRALNQWYYRNP